MELTADELTEARRVIARALEEDLRYGPDVTTLATVPADASTTASMVTREPGVIAGVDVALLVLDEVIGPDAYRVKHRVDAAHSVDVHASWPRAFGSEKAAPWQTARAARCSLKVWPCARRRQTVTRR